MSSKSKQNQIRATLSRHECFVKDTVESGKAHYWRVHPIAAIEFERSNFSTHPARVNSAVRVHEERAAQRAHGAAAKHGVPARVDDYQTGQMSPLLSKPVSDTQWSTYNSEQDFDDDIDAGVDDNSLLDALVSELEQRSGPASTYTNDKQDCEQNFDDDIDAGVDDTSLLDALVSELEQRSGPAGTYANDKQAAQEGLYSPPYTRAQPSANDVPVLPGLDPSLLPYLT